MFLQDWEVRIDRLKCSPFSYEDIADLLHLSFDEHIAEGLHFTCSSMTASTFREKTRDSIVLVAWNPMDDSILGTMTVTVKKDNKQAVYGYLEYLAISPDAKRLGLGTRLLQACTDCCIGGKYLLSDTATEAKSSVNWHLKNGFKIVGLESYASTNYYSYLFRKQIISPSKWDNNLYVRFHYLLSYIRCKLLKKSDGRRTVLGKVLSQLFRR